MNQRPIQKVSPEQRQARKILWHKGVLKWKLHDLQKKIYDSFYANDDYITTLLISRQAGKSWLLCVLAIEACLRKPNVIVKYACPKQKMVKTILKPRMREILEDCPLELMPEYKENDKIYVFPNGSEIQMAGTDNQNYDSIRGGTSVLWIVDEAGFCSDLDNVVFSVLSPTTLTTNGKGILASTPDPDAPEHPFIKQFVEPAKAEGRLFLYTLYDNPLIDEIQKQKIINQYPGGVKNPKFRAEFLCEIVRNYENTVIPEFDDATEKIIVTDQYVRPPFYDTYESMDIGGKDFTVVLFAYYDFIKNAVVIEDEFVLKEKQNSEKIKKGVRQVEERLWGEKPVYLRFADNNNIILLNDLSQHGITFIPTRKDNKEAAINDVRIKIMNHQIIIHPRCKTLIYHLKYATWARKTEKAISSSGYKAFARSADGAHFDACFVPDSKVFTSLGMKNIQDIRVGDLVLTHNNRFKSVTNIMNKEYSGEIKKMKVAGRNEIKCTPDHSFYTATSFSDRKNGNTGQKALTSPTWNTASDLIEYNHHVYIPNIEEGDYSITKEMCFLYGYYVAEGSIGGNGYQIQFAGHKKEVNVETILQKAIYDTYGSGKIGTSKLSLKRHNNGEFKPRQTKLRCYINKDSNGRKLCISNKMLRSELKLLGKSIDKKFPDFIYKLNKEQALYMLSGYLFGDGHFAKSGAKANTISYSIRNGIDMLSRKLSLIGNLTYQNKTHHLQYWWSLDKQQSDILMRMIQSKEDLAYIFKDKLIHDTDIKHQYNYPSNFRKIREIETEYYTGLVYNLEVEEDNSYTIEGVAVHNCDSLIYMIRNVIYGKNPYPPGYGELSSVDRYIRTSPKNTHSIVADMFKLRKTIK
jgi:intein/homing endonuclease